MALFALIPSISYAWSGEVVHVADGDTITVLKGGERVKVQLYGIDCPEGAQSFGENAKAFTSSQVNGKVVEIQEMDIDRYKRIVALVSVGNLNINRHLIEYGYAWVFLRYCKASFCSEWTEVEAQARKTKKGLWKNPKAIPPWEYRRLEKGKDR